MSKKQLLIESAQFISKIKISKELKESLEMSNGKSGTLIVRNIPCTLLDRENQNGRIYSTEVLQEALEKAKPLLEQKQLLSQADEHPESSFVAPSHASHVIINAYIKPNVLLEVDGEQERDNVLFMDWEILNTQEGKNLRALFEAECSIGTSIRGLGDMHGSYVENYDLLGCDCVGNPSSSTYSRMPIHESVKIEFKPSNELKETYTVSSSSTTTTRDLDQAEQLIMNAQEINYGTVVKTQTKFDQENDPKTGAETTITHVEIETSDDEQDIDRALQRAKNALLNPIVSMDSVTIENVKDANKKETVEYEPEQVLNEDEEKSENDLSTEDDKIIKTIIPKDYVPTKDEVDYDYVSGIDDDLVNTFISKWKDYTEGEKQTLMQFVFRKNKLQKIDESEEIDSSSNKMSVEEFLKHCTAHGGDIVEMLLSGIKEINPEYFETIPDNEEIDLARAFEMVKEAGVAIDDDKKECKCESSLNERMDAAIAVDKQKVFDLDGNYELNPSLTHIWDIAEELKNNNDKKDSMEWQRSYNSLVVHNVPKYVIDYINNKENTMKEAFNKQGMNNESVMIEAKEEDPRKGEKFVLKAPNGYVSMEGNALTFKDDPKEALHFVVGKENTGLVHLSEVEKILDTMGVYEIQKYYRVVKNNKPTEDDQKKEGFIGGDLNIKTRDILSGNDIDVSNDKEKDKTKEEGFIGGDLNLKTRDILSGNTVKVSKDKDKDKTKEEGFIGGDLNISTGDIASKNNVDVSWSKDKEDKEKDNKEEGLIAPDINITTGDVASNNNLNASLMEENPNTKYMAELTTNGANGSKVENIPISGVEMDSVIAEVANLYDMKSKKEDGIKIKVIDNKGNQSFMFNPESRALDPIDQVASVQQATQESSGEIEQKDNKLEIDLDDNNHIEKEFETPVQASIAKAGIEQGKIGTDILLSDNVNENLYAEPTNPSDEFVEKPLIDSAETITIVLSDIDYDIDDLEDDDEGNPEELLSLVNSLPNTINVQLNKSLENDPNLLTIILQKAKEQTGLPIRNATVVDVQ